MLASNPMPGFNTRATIGSVMPVWSFEAEKDGDMGEIPVW
jgi:hypothetical protein